MNVEEMLESLANHKDADGNPDERLEMFRVTCLYNDGEDHYKWECDSVRAYEREWGDSTEPNWWADYDGSDEECPLYRQLTPAEVNAKGLEMLVDARALIMPDLRHIWSATLGPAHGNGATPLLAILGVVASAVGLEVTAWQSPG